MRYFLTDMSNRVEHQKQNQLAIEKCPFGFVFRVQLGYRWTHSLIKTKYDNSKNACKFASTRLVVNIIFGMISATSRTASTATAGRSSCPASCRGFATTTASARRAPPATTPTPTVLRRTPWVSSNASPASYWCARALRHPGGDQQC